MTAWNDFNDADAWQSGFDLIPKGGPVTARAAPANIPRPPEMLMRPPQALCSRCRNGCRQPLNLLRKRRANEGLRQRI